MKITLITCTYNAEAVLRRTLDSVLKLTYRDIEHIIIDGRSKDATVSIAQQYKVSNDMMHTGHSVIIVSEPDNGLYDAMNKGIRMATGDYLCFMNAGDCLAVSDDGKCWMDDVPTDKMYSVLYGQTDIVDDAGKYLGPRHLTAPEKLTWRSFKHGMLVCHQSFYANTAIAKRTPYNLKYKLSADVDWCIRIMKEGEHQGLVTYNTHSVLCRYLAGGMSIKNHRASLIERFNIMSAHYGLVPTILRHLWFVVRSVFRR